MRRTASRSSRSRRSPWGFRTRRWTYRSRALCLWQDGAGFARFVAVYMAVAAGALLLWLAAPALGFTALLALSIWHFRHDWAGAPGVLGAIGIVGWPVFWHEAETAAIFVFFAGSEPGAALANVVSWAGAAALALLVPAIASAWLLRRGGGDAAELVLLTLVAAVLHPLLFFAAYFLRLARPAAYRRDPAAPRVAGQNHGTERERMRRGCSDDHRPCVVPRGAVGRVVESPQRTGRQHLRRSALPHRAPCPAGRTS